jgi:ATP-dependent DNA ligase
MEAESAAILPTGGGWQYEPKWDGFRCIAFRDGDEVRLQSKAGKPLERYFPELVKDLISLGPKRFVLDGEIVIRVKGRLAFDQLLLRIHPAASRIARLSRERPAELMVFDLLVDERGKLWAAERLIERRKWLERFARRFFKSGSIALSRATTSLPTAKRWLAGAGADLDGVVAKRRGLAYQSGNRDGMVKIKPIRSADCVVGGFRYAAKGHAIGSLLLGLYDDNGLLHHVGFCSGLNGEVRTGLAERLKALIKPPGFTGRAPGGPSRWSSERSEAWTPLAPKLVVEVTYDHVTENRFRHGTGFLRWRPDKAPTSCSLHQIQRSARHPRSASTGASGISPAQQSPRPPSRRAVRCSPL